MDPSMLSAKCPLEKENNQEGYWSPFGDKARHFGQALTDFDLHTAGEGQIKILDCNDNPSPIGGDGRPTFRNQLSTSVDDPQGGCSCAACVTSVGEQFLVATNMPFPQQDALPQCPPRSIASPDAELPDAFQGPLNEEENDGIREAVRLLDEHVATYAQNLPHNNRFVLEFLIRNHLMVDNPQRLVREFVETSVASFHRYVRNVEPTVGLFGCTVSISMLLFLAFGLQDRRPTHLYPDAG